MPLKKSGAMRTVGLVAAVCGALTITPAAALAADSPEECSVVETSKVFSFLGDQNEYFPAPGGSFEGTLTWAASGAVEQTGSPAYVLGRSVLALGEGGSVQSPSICVDVTRRHLRFAVKAPAAGKLRVEAVDGDGNVTAMRTIDAAEQRGEKSVLGWSVSPEVGLATALGIAGGSRDVSVRIVADSGSWQVDSVQVDPYRG
jgi:hypothetical protein